MAGYAGYSKSNNAIAAENGGRYPMTRAKKIVSEALGITQAEARRRLEEQGPSEYHHTSKKYNVTNYYDTEECINDALGIDPDTLTEADREEIAAQDIAWLKKVEECDHSFRTAKRGGFYCDKCNTHERDTDQGDDDGRYYWLKRKYANNSNYSEIPNS